MSRGGPASSPAPVKKPDPVVSAAASAASTAATNEAITTKKKLKGEVGAEGSSILTSGAGILDDTDLKRNLLGAGAYNHSKGTGLG